MASGDTLCIFHPYDAEPPNADAAMFFRNAQPTRRFTGAGGDRVTIFSGVLPSWYAGGGITITLHVVTPTLNAGNVVFLTEIERRNTDMDSDSFASASTSATTGVSGTSGIPFVVTTTHTSGAQMDSLSAGEAFRVRVTANIANGAWSLLEGASIIAIEIKET